MVPGLPPKQQGNPVGTGSPTKTAMGNPILVSHTKTEGNPGSVEFPDQNSNGKPDPGFPNPKQKETRDQSSFQIKTAIMGNPGSVEFPISKHIYTGNPVGTGFPTTCGFG